LFCAIIILIYFSNIYHTSEIQAHILSYFDEKVVLTMFGMLSKEMHKICCGNALWSYYTKKRFGNRRAKALKVLGWEGKKEKEVNWKDVFLATFAFHQSVILKRQVDRMSLNQFVGNVKQVWRLLYRGSEDGFDSESFHTLCDDHYETIVIVQTITDCIFGGFTPCKWHSYTSYSCNTETFLFALKSLHGQKPVKLLNDGKFQRSIFGSPKCGAAFGFGHDLYISADCDSNNKSYTKLGESFTLPGYEGVLEEYFCGEKNFKVKEIEVFQKIERQHVEPPEPFSS